MKPPHSDIVFSDSSLKSLYKTRDLLVSDCEEVSNHEFYNLLDKRDITNPALQVKQQNNITFNIDKESNLNNKNEKFKYKPRFLFNKYDDPIQGENKTANDFENMNKMTNSMKNLIDEMQLKKIISLTAVLKPNQIPPADVNPISRELVKNVLDVELPKQINKVINSVANQAEKRSTGLYSHGVGGGNEGVKDDQDVNQADDEMSTTNINMIVSRMHRSPAIPESNPNDQLNQKSTNNKHEPVRFAEQTELLTNKPSNLTRKTSLPSYQTVTPTYPRKIHKIEKRIKNLEKLMKRLKVNVKSLHKRVHSTPEVAAAHNADVVAENKETIIDTSNVKFFSSTRTLASNSSSKKMHNVYDEIFYEFRQRSMNLLRYKKSERSILFNQGPILKWNKPVLNFATDEYKLPPKPRFIRERE